MYDVELKACILLSAGKVDLTVLNTTFTRNLVFGVCFLITIIGSVNLTNCTFRNNANRDVLSLCGENCPVTIDNVVQECPALLVRAAQYAQMGKSKVIFALEDGRTDPPIRCQINLLRAVNKCGPLQHKIECANCQKEKTVDEKLKACSKCPYVVYCSRECQVAHWKVYKRECGTERIGTDSDYIEVRR